MKTLIPAILLASIAVFFAANQTPRNEKPHPAAAENIPNALPDKPYATPTKARRLLVISITNGFRHASIPTGQLLLTEMGKRTSAFEAVISENLEDLEPENLKSFDAVCFLSTTQNVFLPHPNVFKNLSPTEKEAAQKREARLKEGLMNFIKSGGGFVGIHSATDSCYEWPEYGKMLNGYFDGHPWNAGTKVSIKVEPGQEKHPLVAMFEGKNVDFKEEIYQFRDPYDSQSVHMLMRLDPEKTDMSLKGIKRTDNDFGVSWARNWDQGRVFYSSLGHNHEIYWHPKVVRHFLAGIQWALGDYQVEISPPKS